MNKFKVVLKNVFLQNLKSPVFWLMLFLPLIMGLGGYWLMNQSTDAPAKIAVVSAQPEVGAAFKNFNQPDIKYTLKYSNESTAKNALIKQKIAGYLKIKVTDSQMQFKLFKTNQSNEINLAALQVAINQIDLGFKAQSLKLSPRVLQQITNTPKLKTQTSLVRNNHLVTQDQENVLTKSLVVMVASILFFFLLIFFMTQMATTIGREKGERVMEIILSSISAKWQFLGEVGGVFLTMVVEVLAYLVLGIGVIFRLQQQPAFKNSFTGLNWQVLVSPEVLFTILFGLTSAFLYLVLAATLGGLVNNLEQVNQAIIPILIPIMIAYILMVAAFAKVTTITQICAYIPLMSNLLMPLLLALGKATGLQAVISYLICVGFTALMTYFSIKMYQNNVLVYSQKGIWAALKASLTFNRKVKVLD